MNFKAVLALPKTAPSEQTYKSIKFIWIVWSTLYVYLWCKYYLFGFHTSKNHQNTYVVTYMLIAFKLHFNRNGKWRIIAKGELCTRYWFRFNLGHLLKFIYSEKATKICYNLPLGFVTSRQNFRGIWRKPELYKHTL